MTNFWKSKNILITGATGFIGSWLTETLVNQGAKVTVLVRKDAFGIESIKHLKNKIKIIYGDLRNKEVIYKAVKDKAVIFHLAAITQVLYSIKNPEETVSVNVGGTLNILEGIRRNHKNQFLVFTSTDKVYGEPKYNPIDEEHCLSSKSPYDASKVAADRLIYAYHISYGLRCGIVRWSNTYGGRDANLLRAVPDFITSVINNKPAVIRGNGKHIRDFIYVTDSVRGIMAVAENSKLSNGEVFNLGTEKPTSIINLANLIIKLSGKKLKVKVLNRMVSGEINTQYLSSKKAKKMLKWRSKVNLETGLKMTMDWYKENLWWNKVMKKVHKDYGIN